MVYGIGVLTIKLSGRQSLMTVLSVLGLWTLAEDNDSYLNKHYIVFGDLERIE